MVIFRLESELIFRTAYALFDFFVGVGSSPFQAVAQLGDAWGRDEDAYGVIAKQFL